MEREKVIVRYFCAGYFEKIPDSFGDSAYRERKHSHSVHEEVVFCSGDSVTAHYRLTFRVDVPETSCGQNDSPVS